MQNIYVPEGSLIYTESNRYYTSSLEGLEKAMREGVILEARAVLCDTSRNLYVDLGGYRGIIPRDEVLYSPSGEEPKDIAVITRVGKSVCFTVTDIHEDETGIKVMLSRRTAQRMCCEDYIMNLERGDVIEAAVTHMEKFGVFCDIGCGVVALLPIDCISVSRIGHPSERFKCGQSIRCVIKELERDTCRVTLTHKELLGTWEENAALFSAGETTCGIVRSVEPYGIFVELTPNLAGLAEWCDTAEPGDCAAVYIKSIIPEKMKVKLVIVDVGTESAKAGGEEYFFEGEHMDKWRYSPEGCRKEIYTEF